MGLVQKEFEVMHLCNWIAHVTSKTEMLVTIFVFRNMTSVSTNQRNKLAPATSIPSTVRASVDVPLHALVYRHPCRNQSGYMLHQYSRARRNRTDGTNAN